MHFYTFRPPAPTVRTGTADAERWSGRPRMVCGKGVRVPLGIGSRIRPPVNIAAPQPKAPLGAKIDLLGHCELTSGYRYRPLCLLWEPWARGPYGRTARHRVSAEAARSGAALAGSACESGARAADSGGAFDAFGRMATSRS